MDASELIDNRIAEFDDWRGRMLARIRKLILEAAPGITEEWKWDTPVWSSDGNILAAGAFHDHLKLNFFHGALLGDHHLFNAGLDAQKTRTIDIFEGENIDEAALRDLIRAAVALNHSKPKASNAVKKPSSAKKSISMKKSKTTKRP